MSNARIEHQAILASAGSGKTFRLAHRYIELLANEVPPERIAAFTFSRKAAGEIFESIVRYLAEAASSNGAAKETSRRIGISNHPPSFFGGLLREYIDHLHQLRIGTLDSFIIGIVQAFPMELGVPLDFRVLDTDGAGADELRSDVLRAILTNGSLRKKERSDFYEAFKQATYGTEEKTFATHLDSFVDSLRRHFRFLPEPGTWGDPGAIWPNGSVWLDATPSPTKSAEDLRARLETGQYAKGVLDGLMKFADFAETFTEEGKWESSIEQNRVVKGLFDKAADLKEGRCVLQYNRKEHILDPADVTSLFRLIQHVVSVELRRALQQTEGLYRLLSTYEQSYEEAMLERGELTFEDAQYLLTPYNPFAVTHGITRNLRDQKRLYIDYRLDSRLDHWLLDEFQDTSDLQWSVLENLADEILQDESGRRSLFYVGDVKQSIYGWRGGNYRLFEHVLNRYGKKISQVRLRTSFRSAKPVIAAVNRVFGTLSDARLPSSVAAEWNKFWETHESQPDAVPDRGFTALLETKAHRASADTKEEAYNLVAALIRSVNPLERGLSVAVLVRRNDTGRDIVEYLRAHCPDLTVIHEGNATIRDCAAVQTILELVKIAAHPGDTFALRYLQMTPLASALSISQDMGEFSLSLLSQIYSEGFESFVRDWGGKLSDATSLDDFSRLRLDALAEAAGRFDTRGQLDCDAFLRFIKAHQIRESAAESAVRVMTIHQSKGLGFDVVILPDLAGRDIRHAHRLDLFISDGTGRTKGRWALKMPRRSIASVDTVLAEAVREQDDSECFDALCLLYVAMTRARHALYMIAPEHKRKNTSLDAASLLREQCTRGSANPTIETEIAGTMCATVYAEGDPDWFSRIPPRTESPPPTDAARLPSEMLDRVLSGTQVRRVEPSAEGKPPGDAPRLFDADGYAARLRGTAIHALFEEVDWLHDTDPDALIAKWNRLSSAPPDVKQQAAEHFRNAIRSKEIQRALARPVGRVRLWREKAFDVLLGNQMISGVLDRVVFLLDDKDTPISARIFDYKSDALSSSAEINAAAASYRIQMNIYARALSRMAHLPLKNIETALIFTNAGKVVPL